MGVVEEIRGVGIDKRGGRDLKAVGVGVIDRNMV
jgi:hypothetical protein